MILRQQVPSGIGVCLLATLAFCNRDSKAAKERKMDPSRVIDIVPGRSMGDARLGMKVEELPSRAVIRRPGGSLDDVQLLINDAGEVEDIWVDDVHGFPHRLRLQGKEIPRDATVKSVQTIVGKCEPIPGIKGGFFYNCALGLALGTDLSKQTLQIRVKPISTK